MINVTYTKKTFILTQQDYQKLNSKNFAKKEADNTYTLEPYEALYLQEKNKITIIQPTTKTPLTFDHLLKKTKIELNNYLVYKNLKSMGYIVKSGLKYGFTFRIYDKGIKQNEDHSLWLVEPISENETLKIKDLTGKNRIAHSTRKKLLLAIIDNENSITYLETNWKRL